MIHSIPSSATVLQNGGLQNTKNLVSPSGDKKPRNIDTTQKQTPGSGQVKAGLSKPVSLRTESAAVFLTGQKHGGPKENPLTGALNFERHQGARQQGFAFGLQKEGKIGNTLPDRPAIPSEPIELIANTVETSVTPVTVYSDEDSASTDLSATPTNTTEINSATEANASAVTQPISNTSATLVTANEEFNVTISIADDNDESKITSRGTVQIEEGGSYVFRFSDHPGSKYVIHGVEGGNGVTNPNNIKGHIFLNANQQESGFLRFANNLTFADTKSQDSLENKVDVFLKKKSDIAHEAAAPEEKSSLNKTGKINRKQLEAFNLLPTPAEKILNIHDDRFDTAQFTSKENLSLSLAANLQGNRPDAPANPIDAQKQSGKKHKFGHVNKNIEKLAGEIGNKYSVAKKLNEPPLFSQSVFNRIT